MKVRAAGVALSAMSVLLAAQPTLAQRAAPPTGAPAAQPGSAVPGAAQGGRPANGPGAPRAPAAPEVPAVGAAAHATGFRPVTEAQLSNPPPGDWLSWRGNVNGWGYSPLNQVNKTNAAQLQYAWGWVMQDGAQETTPIVHDGVMYIANPGGDVQALNAETGDLIWQYEHQNAPGQENRRGGLNRGLAIYGDKIYLASPDVYVVALDARTGKLAWKTFVGDKDTRKGLSAAPIVADGKVFQGVRGCNSFQEEKCSLIALDAETGKEIWRHTTIQKPGEGQDTWNNAEMTLRGGGDIWTTASYDPKTDLVYIGTAQAKPWARVSRGHDEAALYTVSTLALKADTGESVWYRQYIPGESNDMDEAFESILVDIAGKPSYVTMGKMGILWRGDRTTGKALPAFDLGYQDQIDLNPDGTFARYREGKVATQLDTPMNLCPSSAGFKSWRAMAYSPATRAVYVPANINCDDGRSYRAVQMTNLGGGNGGAESKRSFHPKSPGQIGRFIAMSVDTGKVLWEHPMRTPANTATLTTAGGLVFGGDWDRNFFAFDEATGRVLWQTRLPQAAQGFPISYEVKGRQYVAIPVGTGGASWSTSVPAQLTPEIKRPDSGNMMMVFALPKRG